MNTNVFNSMKKVIGRTPGISSFITMKTPKTSFYMKNLTVSYHTLNKYQSILTSKKPFEQYHIMQNINRRYSRVNRKANKENKEEEIIIDVTTDSDHTNTNYTNSQHKNNNAVDAEIVNDDVIEESNKIFRGELSSDKFVKGEYTIVKDDFKKTFVFYLKLAGLVCLLIYGIKKTRSSYRNYKNKETGLAKTIFKIIAFGGIAITGLILAAGQISYTISIIRKITLLKDGKRIKLYHLNLFTTTYPIKIVRKLEKEDMFSMDPDVIYLSKLSGMPFAVKQTEKTFNEDDAEYCLYYIWKRAEVVDKDILKHVLQSKEIDVVDN